MAFQKQKEARKLAADLDIEVNFEEQRWQIVKPQFAYEGKDEGIVTTEEYWKITFLNQIVDDAVISLNERLDQMCECCNIFIVASDVNEYRKLDKLKLKDGSERLAGDPNATPSSDVDDLN